MISVTLHYIGYGRKDTGDWCFEDGYLTFKDIAELYLKANLKSCTLNIISDCSYSGCWVKACMEFLDEQGVQPCGHKTREKGMQLKVYASCPPSEIPMQYKFSINGKLDADTISGQQLNVYYIDCTEYRCDNKTDHGPCTLTPDDTWQKWVESHRIQSIQGIT